MIWQNPWAWIGLAAIAVPILVHLLGRRRPKPLRFPTLRFLDATRIVPARRHRLNDIPLLLVRIGIIAAAVAALAQPLLTGLVRQSSASATARAIVIDTSASMDRPTPAGRRGLDAARDLAQTIGTDATIARVIDAPILATGIGAATAWLAAQPARRELVVVSDFQAGALDRVELTTVPADVGISLRAIDVVAEDSIAMPAESWGAHSMRADLQLSRESTTVAWQPAQTPTSADVPAFIQLVARPEDRGGLDAAVAAARIEGVPSAREGRPVTIVFAGASERSAIGARVRAIDQPWMFDVVEAIDRDATIDSLARQPIAGVGEANGAPASAAPIVVDDRGRVLFSAAADGSGPGARLVIFAAVSAGEAISAALIGRTWREAGRTGTSVRESDPNRVDQDTLRSWERAPGTVSAPADASDGRSDGRWLWALALLLIGVETWMRRAPRPATTTKEVSHARVA